jgi:hypothetical protein
MFYIYFFTIITANLVVVALSPDISMLNAIFLCVFLVMVRDKLHDIRHNLRLLRNITLLNLAGSVFMVFLYILCGLMGSLCVLIIAATLYMTRKMDSPGSSA